MAFEPGFSLLVPTDFTEKSKDALVFAASLIKERGGLIQLLHVVDSIPELKPTTIDTARSRLAEYAKEQHDILDVTIIPNIVTGNIFDTIGESAAKLGTNMIVMGVHGMHGIQFVIGSFAARVILGSTIPVLLISSDLRFKGFRKIILPVDLSRKEDKLIAKAKELALQYRSTIHIFSYIEARSLIKKAILRSKINRIAKSLKKVGIRTTSKIIYPNGSNTIENILDYSKVVDADLIMLMLRSQGNTKEFIVGQAENSLIQESNLPLFIINPLIEKGRP